MDMSCGLRGGLVATAMQQQPAATIIYTSDETGWQPMVTPLPLISTPPIREIPKESIIANTDFTTTSAIAKRRLSSRKKRRQNRHSADTSLLPPPLPAVNNAPHLQEPPLLMTRPSPLTPPQAHHQGCVVGTTPLVANCSTQYIPIGALPQHSQVITASQLPPEMLYRMLHQGEHHQGGMTSSGLVPQQQDHQLLAATTHTHTAATLQQLQHLHQLQQQYQQQLTMMQMYGIPQQSGLVHAQPQLQLQGGVPLLSHAPHSNQLIGLPVYAPQHHSIPIATAIAPPELLVQVQNGSWVAPATAPPMFGSCIVNPLQPGLLTTSLVK